jgi:hypothetical protein
LKPFRVVSGSMNIGNELHKHNIWDLFETCHKCQPYPLSKCVENDSRTARTLEAAINFIKKFNFFQVLHFTVLYINITEQWPRIKTNFALIKVQSRGELPYV